MFLTYTVVKEGAEILWVSTVPIEDPLVFVIVHLCVNVANPVGNSSVEEISGFCFCFFTSLIVQELNPATPN